MCLSGVGDALTFSPFIEELKKAKPDILIDVLVMFKASESIYKSHPAVNRVFYSDFVNQGAVKSFSDVINLRKNKYDAVVAAMPANRWEYNVIQMMIGGRRIGHQYNHYNKINLNFLKQDSIFEDETIHVVENNLKLLKFFDVPYPTNPPTLSIRLTSGDREAACEWIKSHVKGSSILIGFHPGSAKFKNHINKRWAKEKYAELAIKFVDEKNATILIMGGPEEQDLKDEICDMADIPNVISVDNTSLRVSAAIIEKCNVMVTNDSALMHLSAAVQTPVAAIFAYTNPAMLYPWKVRHKIIRKPLSCSPCFYYSPRYAECHAKKEYECIKSITVDEVFTATEALLEEK